MNTSILQKGAFFFLFIFFQNESMAQLYVSPNSYVFATNEVVYVKEQVELNATTSNFYLRDSAQLLQGTTTNSGNSGLGNLSVYQEGSTNNFHYNYWCSPVGSSLATVGNSAFSITQLKDVTSLTGFNNPVILATNNYNGTASPLAIAPFWVNKLIGSSNYGNWTAVGGAGTLNAGEGFSMKGTSGTNAITVNGVQNNPGSKQRYDFRGKPNDGTISIPVGALQFTLTGNPYPSAIDLAAFLIEQTNCTGIAYFWEQDKTVNSHYIADYKGGYGTYSPIARGGTGIYVPATFFSYDGSGNPGPSTGVGTAFERRFSPIGQGFMIDGVVNGAVEMKNSYRIYVKEGVANNSQFEKSTNNPKTNTEKDYLSKIKSISGFDYKTVSVAPTPQIRLNTLMNNQGVRQLALAFVPEATDGPDRAMDAMSSSENSPADVYFLINNIEYIINATNFDINKKIPIGFRNTKTAIYKITVKDIINFPDVDAIFLHDKVKDTYHDIKNSFHEMELPAGKNNTQFEITFKDNKTLDVDGVAKEDFIVYQNNPLKSLTISNPNGLELASCGVYDVAGKLIFTQEDLGDQASYSFSTASYGDGIYIVKLTTKDNKVFGKKVIIKN
ncbi:T9SS type A sorting domain-containing protein [Flavobacterium sp. FPG59]|jgi:hypothetical protein|uniref:T9SS type A sorting domain-containing protein n=1 Tax=Flavobacterium sp. FPG59 TaxID=1929267 RepID=UPI000A3C8C9A|nr:T9SS type A sorting domain-containing protein [Flavobacterium sp. FPG59]